MTDPIQTQPDKDPAGQNGTAFRLNTREWIVAVLIVFSIIGVGITDFAPAVSHFYQKSSDFPQQNPILYQHQR